MDEHGHAKGSRNGEGENWHRGQLRNTAFSFQTMT